MRKISRWSDGGFFITETTKWICFLYFLLLDWFFIFLCDDFSELIYFILFFLDLLMQKFSYLSILFLDMDQGVLNVVLEVDILAEIGLEDLVFHLHTIILTCSLIDSSLALFYFWSQFCILFCQVFVGRLQLLLNLLKFGLGFLQITIFLKKHSI